jgi:hypothetical protein
MFSDSAARVKLLVSTIRMNVRIAVILSITVQTPVEVGFWVLGFGFWFLVFACVVLWVCSCGVGFSLNSRWSISVAPVRGGTYFLCMPQRK